MNRFGRACSIILDDQLFTGLRVSFTVTRTSKPEPNVLEMEVSNLSPDTRARLVPKKTRVVLNAGYQGTIGVIYAGTIRTAYTRQDGPTVYTKITAGDGDFAYGGANVSVSLAKGASLEQVVSKMAAAMGVDASQALERARLADGTGAKRYSRGYVASGKASTELSLALSRHGLKWSIQDGRLQVLASTETEKGTAVLLTPETGLLGSPQPNDKKESKGPPTTTINSLLDHTIRPGTLLEVKSEFVNGLFKAQAVKHRGDTHGDTWETETEAVAL